MFKIASRYIYVYIYFFEHDGAPDCAAFKLKRINIFKLFRMRIEKRKKQKRSLHGPPCPLWGAGHPSVVVLAHASCHSGDNLWRKQKTWITWHVCVTTKPLAYRTPSRTYIRGSWHVPGKCLSILSGFPLWILPTKSLHQAAQHQEARLISGRPSKLWQLQELSFSKLQT